MGRSQLDYLRDDLLPLTVYQEVPGNFPFPVITPAGLLPRSSEMIKLLDGPGKGKYYTVPVGMARFQYPDIPQHLTVCDLTQALDFSAQVQVYYYRRVTEFGFFKVQE